MKRQIKFRGKRTDTGEWIYGDLLTSNGTECEVSDWNDVVYSRYDVGPDTIGQFTGLLDKNGREIYEGDFIKIQWNFGEESVEEISYSVEYAYWMYGNNPLCEIIGEECCYEVIGNVHDNPELLKGGEE